MGLQIDRDKVIYFHKSIELKPISPSNKSSMKSTKSNTIIEMMLRVRSTESTKMNIDCLPVFCISLFAPNTPMITPTVVQSPSHSPFVMFSFPLIEYEIVFAAAAYITRNIEVDEATKGGYPSPISNCM